MSDTWVPFVIERAASHHRRTSEAHASLELRIDVRDVSHDLGAWDERERPLEEQLGDIVTRIVVAGGIVYRHWEREVYDYTVAERQRRRDEAVRIEREQREADDRARVKRLLREAGCFRDAAVIRDYVAAARAAHADAAEPVDRERFEAWATRAPSQRPIAWNPVTSGEYLRESDSPVSGDRVSGEHLPFA